MLLALAETDNDATGFMEGIVCMRLGGICSKICMPFAELETCVRDHTLFCEYAIALFCGCEMA